MHHGRVKKGVCALWESEGGGCVHYGRVREGVCALWESEGGCVCIMGE